MLEHALKLASVGLPVFPCIARSKAPATKSGFLAATLDEEKIRNWWTSKPTCNIGVAVPEGIIVVDVDAGAYEHLADSTETFLPLTVSASTPGKGGGKHLWYLLPPGVRVTPKIKIIDGVDIRTTGSYVVAPPSIHPMGGTYVWDDDYLPERQHLVMCPEWIVSACLMPTQDEDKNRVDLIEMMKGLAPGTRQVGLFRAACSMRARGFLKDEAKIVLQELARVSEGKGYDKWPNINALVKRVWGRYEQSRAVDDKKLWTLDELISADLGNVDWFVDDVLSSGLALVYADEKVGKSVAVANLSISLATRERVWGRYNVPKARGVLYLDLEQSPIHAQARWRKMLDGRTPPNNLRVKFEWPRMDEGGLDKLKETLRAEPDIDLVVIDIWSLFKPLDAQVGTGNAYDSDYAMFEPMKKLAAEYNVCVMLVHHTNKQGTYSGSRATGGTMDYLFRIDRELDSDLAVVEMGGKNVEHRTVGMRFDTEKMRFNWVSGG